MTPIAIKTDYSLLSSLIKISDLINYLVSNNIKVAGILDDNLFGVIEFYNACKENDIKPLIGLDLKVNKFNIYLYCKNFDGYKSLIKLNSLMQEKELDYVDLKKYSNDLIAILPSGSYTVYDTVSKIFSDTYLSYRDDYDKSNALLLSKKIVYLDICRAFELKDIKYLNILNNIKTDNKEDVVSLYKEDYLNKKRNEQDEETLKEIIDMVDIDIPFNKRYIPSYENKLNDSFKYLLLLCKKGLEKRFNGHVSEEYTKRIKYELSVIKKMGFVDYFLIVYDYIKYAKQNNILVGPGRGSAAGSLVSYAIGITNVDPIKYDLLFERFLNPERITMPDIDVDFEDVRRDDVINYCKDKYGSKNVMNIITYGTLGSKQVIRDTAKYLGIDNNRVNKLLYLMSDKPKALLKDNLDINSNSNANKIKVMLNEDKDLGNLYKAASKIEGLKRQISIHASGVVISSIELDDLIPICLNGDTYISGITYEYLEKLGLLKMDFLSLHNLTIIHNTLDLVKSSTGEDIDLYDIDLEDKETYELFRKADTDGVFQFDSSGMKNFLKKLAPVEFSDLFAANALFRPGPMNNIDSYILRRNGKEKIDYIDESLKDILSPTYGIIVYQEQVMLILQRMASFSLAESDNVRRAISKKKIKLIEEAKEKFIKGSLSNGYKEEVAVKVYDLIVKFADYGFNKSHSVSYALVGYWMAYLKRHYTVMFIVSNLNLSTGSEEKTKAYLDECKKESIKIYKPEINKSNDTYIIKDNNILLPFNIINDLGKVSIDEIISERVKNGEYKDIFDFVVRMNGKSVNRKIIERLIDSDAFRSFKLNHKTIYSNLDDILNYASLLKDLDESLVMKPVINYVDEYSPEELMEMELDSYGFYITNHPASKYKDTVKTNDVSKYFDKYIEMVVMVGSIRKIKTKKGEDMAFLSGSDEMGEMDFVIFPKNFNMLTGVNKNSLIKIRGQVTKRFDEYQVVINNLTIL